MMKERKSKYILHCDVTNAYFSMEAVFDPSIRGKPVVILSNSDSNVVARNNESKLLGIKMGQPIFQIQDIINKHGVILKSSNYPLIASMSKRFHLLIKDFAQNSESYSVDEAFLDLTSHGHFDLDSTGKTIKNRCLKWLGLPVGVGIGHTKTMAKLADHLSKKRPEYNGVCNLTALSEEQVDKILQTIPTEDVWGIGSKLSARLADLNIHTALELKQADPTWIRQQFSVVVQKTVFELNDICCIELEEIAPPRKQIISSRGFGADVIELFELQEAVTEYTVEACKKLREDLSVTSAITVWIQNSRFQTKEPRYSPYLRIPLPSPTDNTLQITNIALWALRKIYKRGPHYRKAGVLFDDIIPRSGSQSDMFSHQNQVSKTTQLMTTIDALNTRFGKGTIRPASQGYNHRWATRHDLISNAYTTRWNELPIIKI